MPDISTGSAMELISHGVFVVNRTANQRACLQNSWGWFDQYGSSAAVETWGGNIIGMGFTPYFIG